MNTYIIAEIGINHNGDMNITKKLIDTAVIAGCDAVKFQKRTIDKVYTEEYLTSPRVSPWGNTQREQKEGLEFNEIQYDEINKYCEFKGIDWFASAWYIGSQKFLQKYNLKYNKVASAMLTNYELLEEIANEKKYTFISTGMSTYDEIDKAVQIFRKKNCSFELMHCNSTYPMKNEDANLLMINNLKYRYDCKVGYSGHETGTLVSISAVALGATSIERHITLDKSMYGSDQAASIEPYELYKLVKEIREIEKILGNGQKVLNEEEMKVRKKLRG
ncbi:N-acetylneuraminate synthase family protein [Clostridium sporogenes]|uniref:N-acetylneuraminate synthase family protein n=1 Tax=Clostridium sporogenes TaxID=1509 RepID=UPI002236FEC1|nr:N-acetylneuraminate synthase family protein [Clostridium sporogenes]MCW6087739.1 N-acetylneuraminate synthase family protein [Clostridium sporogenes]